MTPSNPRPAGLTPEESRAAFALAGIFALRMLGMFLILPVFALYAEHLTHVTPVLVGLAIGAYGLTQALFSIPFGWVSDRIGRKPVIVVGLLIFAVGSVVAAESTDIWGVILGRSLQGAGAIASTVMAFAADLSREQVRTRVMAVIGTSIGLAFAVSMVLGPILDGWVGVPGIFWITAGLALAGIALVLFVVPNPKATHFHRDAEVVPGQVGRALRDPDLLRLDFSVFTLHLVMTSFFLAVPVVLRDAGLPGMHHWWLYLPALVLGMALMIPAIVIAERHHKLKPILLGAILALTLAQLGFWALHESIWGMAAAMVLYFTAFNVMEASMPSLVSKMAPAANKGTAMGAYTTSQFLGAFLGGAIGGWVHHHFGLAEVFLFCAGMTSIWWVVALGLTPPRYLSNHMLPIGTLDAAQARELEMLFLKIEGVAEAEIIPEDGVAYLKIDPKRVTPQQLDEFLAAQG